MRLLVVAGTGYAGPALLTAGWLLGGDIDPRLPIMAITVITILSAWRVDQILRRVEHRATHDPLTGVLDHEAFRQAAGAIAGRTSTVRSERHQSPDGSWFLGVLDLDAFKKLNDTHGHAIGDEVLSITARRIRGALRSEDVVGRMGGDEFAILYRDAGPEAVATRLSARLQAPISTAGLRLQVRVSLGVTRLLPDDRHPEAAVTAALRRADIAMYTAKRGDEAVAYDDGTGV